MAAKTQEFSISSLQAKPSKELEDGIKKAKEELFNLRFQSVTGSLSNPSRVKKLHKGIARMNTLLRERELGIIEEPAPKETDKGKKKKKATSEASKGAKDAEKA
ncbi:MAG: 50S ribosomal protein L29 [Aeriscardovia sp.]|nr:50S ribosomal protein L29 [Aeriscardovia sp.]